MSKITQDELKSMIVSQIQSQGLSNVFNHDTVAEIQKRINGEYQYNQSKKAIEQINAPTTETIETVPAPMPESIISEGPTSFPYEQEVQPEPAQNTDNVTSSSLQGSEPTDVPYEPKSNVAFSPPPLPTILEKIPAEKLIVWDYNELATSGEALAYRPIRTMDNPDYKTTMHELWMKSGNTKAEVYVAKFEKIGDLLFDYIQGTSRFVENRDLSVEPTPSADVFNNPYAEESKPAIDNPQTETDLRKTIENSVDLETVIYKVVKDIIKDYGMKL